MFWSGGDHVILTKGVEDDLIDQYRKTNDIKCRNKVLESNYKLISDVVSNFDHIYSLDQAELFNEGFLGMCKAMEKYDRNRGTKFSTYAVNWIYVYIWGFIKRVARIVTITEYANSQILRLKKEIDHEMLKDEWGDYKYNQIVALTNQSVHDIQLKKNIISRIDPLKDIKNEKVMHIILEILKSFSFKEKVILRCRYGLNHGKRRSLDEIGFPFGISKERIRQIEDKAIKRFKLRLAKYGIKEFNDFYVD
jgi:RNA polymerase sigma factor (sigma-70 family)